MYTLYTNQIGNPPHDVLKNYLYKPSQLLNLRWVIILFFFFFFVTIRLLINLDCKEDDNTQVKMNRIGGAMVSMFSLIVVDRGFERDSARTN